MEMAEATEVTVAEEMQDTLTEGAVIRKRKSFTREEKLKAIIFYHYNGPVSISLPIPRL